VAEPAPLLPPPRPTPDEDDPRTQLRRGVVDALRALPGHFRSETVIEGLAATDLFSLNAVLGTTIEVQVVRTLNRLRDVWDPDERWARYAFVRQPQTFPDVRLQAQRGGEVDVALGIELKGWYLLAKEREPSLRYQVTPAACSDWDLVAVVPWYLTNVLSGAPVAMTPWVESARYTAEYRNHWWQHVRDTRADAPIASPADVRPYPTKDMRIADVPARDGGSNFGRLARVAGLMDDFITAALQVEIAGVAASSWVSFVRLHAEHTDGEEIAVRLERDLQRRFGDLGTRRSAEVLDHLEAIARLLR
jgi:hypothetical protein